MTPRTALLLLAAVAINTSITKLHVDEDKVPLELKGKSIPEIRQYFRYFIVFDRFISSRDLWQGKVKLNRSKLIFVGYANQGKTSLLHILKTRKSLQGERCSTDGVEVDTWEEKINNGDTIIFSTWDFAGQEVSKMKQCICVFY